MTAVLFERQGGHYTGQGIAPQEEGDELREGCQARRDGAFQIVFIEIQFLEPREGSQARRDGAFQIVDSETHFGNVAVSTGHTSTVAAWICVLARARVEKGPAAASPSGDVSSIGKVLKVWGLGLDLGWGLDLDLGAYSRPL